MPRNNRTMRDKGTPGRGAQPFASHWKAYFDAGWHPLWFPPEKKFPPPTGYTGWHGADATGDQLRAVAANEPDSNIGVRLSGQLIGIDVDNYKDKQGAATLAEAEKRWGILQDASDEGWAEIRCTARNDGVSGIRFFRVPEGTVLHERIDFPELGLGGIEILQRHHRYAVLPPSIHPAMQVPYRWLIEGQELHEYDAEEIPAGWVPPIDELPWLPGRWIDELRDDRPRSERRAASPEIESFLTELNEPRADPCKATRGALQQATEALYSKAGDSRHDAIRNGVLALLRAGERLHQGVLTALDELEEKFVEEVAEERGGENHAESEFFRMVYGAGGVGAILDTPTRSMRKGCHCADRLKPEEDPVEPEEIEPDEEEAFWQSRDSLALIREYAYSKMASAWAVLGGVLCNTAAATSPRLRLPAVVGTDSANLNLFLALVGPSGVGKKIAMDTARRTVQVPEFTSRPLGSAEGIRNLFVKWNEENKEYEQFNNRAMLMAEEISSVAALGGRQGSLLFPELCKIWSDETIGQNNAEKDRNITVASGTYRCCLMAGVQPERAGAILNDDLAGLGLPQRFLWLPVIDPNMLPWDRLPEAPDSMVWNPRSVAGPAVAKPGEPEPEMRGVNVNGKWHSFGGGTENPKAGLGGAYDFPETTNIKLCRKIWDEARKTHYLKGSGKVQMLDLDKHAVLVRIKVAAILAIMEERLEVTEEDWELAGFIMRKSTQTRGEVQRTLTEQAQERNRTRGKQEAAREVIKRETVAEHDTSRYEDAAKKVCGKIRELVRSSPGGVTRSEMVRSISGRDRKEFGGAEFVNDVIERLITAGDVRLDGDTKKYLVPEKKSQRRGAKK